MQPKSDGNRDEKQNFGQTEPSECVRQIRPLALLRLGKICPARIRDIAEVMPQTHFLQDCCGFAGARSLSDQTSHTLAAWRSA